MVNNVVSQHDKKGGRPYPNWLIQGFKEVLSECALRDMDFAGYHYTWERGECTSSSVKIRLDRLLVNTNFSMISWRQS